MIDFFLKFLEAQIDYQIILIGFGLYLAAVWVMFSLWVFMDARKRFHNTLAATLLALFVLPLNLPGLIFYLIIRPEEDLLPGEMDMYQAAAGGVNVPLVNYVGDNGEIVMSLNLKMSPSFNPAADMNVNVGWNSDRSDMSVSNENSISMSEMRSQRSSEAVQERPSVDRFAGIRNHAKNSISKVQGAMKKSMSKMDETTENTTEEAADTAETHQKKGKK